MSEPSCIFCKIVAGEIPALRVYEDDAVLVFLDVAPLAEGHLIVVPKQHYERLEDMGAEAVAAVTRNWPQLGRALMKATSVTAYNVLHNNGKEAGQEVPHVHFHIIPRAASDGLGYRWKASKYPGGRAEELHRQLIAALRS